MVVSFGAAHLMFGLMFGFPVSISCLNINGFRAVRDIIKADQKRRA